jgi:glycerol-3-phosphate dehydrogenase (NAD+)
MHIGCSPFSELYLQGIDFNDRGVVLISSTIADGLGVECSVLMGANVANEVAQDQFCEATIGCKDVEHGELYVKLFNSRTFLVNVVTDTVGGTFAAVLACVLSRAAVRIHT